MTTIHTKARLNAQGQFEFVELPDMPTETWVDITITYETAEERAAKDEQWNTSFEAGKEAMQRLADIVMQEYLNGETEALDLDELERDADEV